MKLGEKLKLLRKEKDLTLDKLAEMSGMAKATLSRIENGVTTGNLLKVITKNTSKAIFVLAKITLLILNHVHVFAGSSSEHALNFSHIPQCFGIPSLISLSERRSAISFLSLSFFVCEIISLSV